ncbi:MAG: adenosylcobinamide-GDP ribazoletransferase [Rhizobiaceae bacterium]
MASGNPLGDVAACVGFYTRLPAGLLSQPSADFAPAQWAAPVAGLLVGLIGGGALLIASWIGLPPLVTALIAVAATMLVTGALHEDGLADTADGLGGGATRERKLEIMRDSRIGTYGVAALLFSVLLRVATLAALTPAEGFVALIAAHAAGRALMPYLLATSPSARGDGLSANIGTVSQRTALMALAIGAGALLLLGFLPALAAAAMLGLWLLAVRAVAHRQIGGHTGDICGALEQGGEILVLLAATAIVI